MDDDTQDNKTRNLKIEEYCNKNHFYFVWFNRTIEEVIFKEKAPNSEKKQKAEQFASNNEIDEKLIMRFKKSNQNNRCSSNFLTVINKIDTSKNEV